MPDGAGSYVIIGLVGSAESLSGRQRAGGQARRHAACSDSPEIGRSQLPVCQRTASCQGAGMLGCADPAGLAGLAGLGSTLFPQVPTDSDSDATGAAARCRAATARRDQLKLRRRCKKYHAGRPE